MILNVTSHSIVEVYMAIVHHKYMMAEKCACKMLYMFVENKVLCKNGVNILDWYIKLVTSC